MKYKLLKIWYSGCGKPAPKARIEKTGTGTGSNFGPAAVCILCAILANIKINQDKSRYQDDKKKADLRAYLFSI